MFATPSGLLEGLFPFFFFLSWLPLSRWPIRRVCSSRRPVCQTGRPSPFSAVSPVLAINGFRKTHGTTVAVDDLSLEVEAVEIFGLIGPNDTGKTTAASL